MRINLFFRRIIFPVITTNLFCSFLAAQVQVNEPVSWLGETRGPYPTGTTTDTWTDSARDELATLAPDDKRRVMVQIWYPVSHMDNPEYAQYAKDIGLYEQNLQEIFKSLASLPTASILNSSLLETEERFPIVLYNHGGGSPIFTGTAQAEFLASYGFIVVSIGHTDDSGLAKFPGGEEYIKDNLKPRISLAEAQQQGWSQMQLYQSEVEYWEDMHRWYVEDITFALDRLEQLDETPGNLFFHRLDLERVGTLGWSRGGAISFQATVDDHRVKAAVNLDGTLFGRSIERQGSDKPLLFIQSLQSTDRVVEGFADASLEELKYAIESYTWGMFRRTTNDWYRIKLDGAIHHSFNDYIFAYETSPQGAIAANRGHQIINTLILEFFGKYLNGNSDTPFLSGEDSYPELHIAKGLASETQ